MHVLLSQLTFPSELLHNFLRQVLPRYLFTYTSCLIILELLTLKIVSEIRPANYTNLHCEI